MHTAILIACHAVFASFAFSSLLQLPENLKYHINSNGTTVQLISEETRLNNSQNKVNGLPKKDQQIERASNGTGTEINNKTVKAKNTNSKIKHDQRYNNKVLNSIPILRKIHERVTRSKDAVWATITLTSICILLVLAVAQSRMWKDHYYKESQGVPLPNFNERVLFKDVMERKISTMKKFFKKKKPKEKDVTELESLLPPSEWDI